MNSVGRILLLGFSLNAVMATAQDDFFGDIDISVESSTRTEKSWALTGWVRQKATYGLRSPDGVFSRSEQDWSKMETSFYGRLDWALQDTTAIRIAAKVSGDAIYGLKEEEKFNADEVDEFETRFEWLDVYFETELTDSLYVKAGQQIVAWGEAENLRITDLINTQDQFAFGQQDLENLRLPVPAIRLNYAFDDLLIDGVITYKAGRDDIAPAYDEFDPFITFRPSVAVINKQRPDNEAEYFLRLSGHYSQGDWSVMVGEGNSNSLDILTINFNNTTINDIRLSQDRFSAMGASINWTKGSWLTFAEVGLHKGARTQPDSSVLFSYAQGWPEKDRVLSAFGLEYSGFSNTTISTELDYLRIKAHETFLTEDENQLGLSARVIWNGFNDRLQMMAVFTEVPDQGGRIWRVTLDYDWSDSIELGLLWVNYSAAQGAPLYNYRHNDSIQLQFEYSFQH